MGLLLLWQRKTLSSCPKIVDHYKTWQNWSTINHHSSDIKSPPGKLGGLFSHCSGIKKEIVKLLFAVKSILHNISDIKMLED